jgi:hypothetical protein
VLCRGSRLLRARCVVGLCPRGVGLHSSLEATRPDLAGAGLWREALVLAMEAGLSVDPLD